MNLPAFLNKYLGIAKIGDTAVNIGQCVGLIEAWLDTNRCPHIWGNADQLMQNADLQTYKIVVNLPDNFPAPGDIVCWDGSWGNGAGHCAVVVAANANSLAVLEQNDPDGAPCLLATHDYSGVMGWIKLPEGV